MGPIKTEVPEKEKDWRSVKEFSRQRKEAKLLKQAAKKEIEKVTVPERVSRECATTSHPVRQKPTISIAVPGSILENAQSQALRTYLAGQIARAACIFKVDEVVVFDDIGGSGPQDVVPSTATANSSELPEVRRSCLQLARILQYLECPQYLRKAFFPHHIDLSYAGLLNPLDAPHHLLQTEEFPFREGVVIDQPSKKGSVVDVGLHRNIHVDRGLTPGLRVTVEFLPKMEGSKKLRGQVVPPTKPTSVTGKYWGYTVRIASSLSAVFSEGPHEKGYDLTIGTSDKGRLIDAVTTADIPPHDHAIMVFGGLQGLEGALEGDSVLNVDEPSLLFDMYLNTCPEQGARTIRTEEAILITLAALRPLLALPASTSSSS